MPERFHTQTFTGSVGGDVGAQLFTQDSNPSSHVVDDTGSQWSGDALDADILSQANFMQEQLAAMENRPCCFVCAQ